MRSFRQLALASATAVALGTVFAGGIAAAQPAPAAPTDAAPYTAEDAAAVLDARLAALKTVLRLTPDQEKLWPPVEASIRDAVKGAIERREKRLSAPPPATVLDVLANVATAEQARGKALANFVEAAKPFVASLTPAQRNRIPTSRGARQWPAAQHLRAVDLRGGGVMRALTLLALAAPALGALAAPAAAFQRRRLRSRPSRPWPAAAASASIAARGAAVAAMARCMWPRTRSS